MLSSLILNITSRYRHAWCQKVYVGQHYWNPTSISYVDHCTAYLLWILIQVIITDNGCYYSMDTPTNAIARATPRTKLSLDAGSNRPVQTEQTVGTANAKRWKRFQELKRRRELIQRDGRQQKKRRSSPPRGAEDTPDRGS
jgi:hypothetical protein